MPPRYVDHTGNESLFNLGSLATTPGFLFLPIMMIAQNIGNSWSELLTLCCVPNNACESTDDRHSCICPTNEQFCTELCESLCHGNRVRLRRKA
jgi:hypothetical protein